MSASHRIAITQGEPAGCGPDILLQLIDHPAFRALDVEPVYIGDTDLLQKRAVQLGLGCDFEPFTPEDSRPLKAAFHALHLPLAPEVRDGVPNPGHQPQVIDCLRQAVAGCLKGELDAVVTGPVQKAAIREAGIPFTGQTEFIADLCGVTRPLMHFSAGDMQVALATTHLPLAKVPAAMDTGLIVHQLHTLNDGLKRYFGMERPRILVCGLNPHAGEQGWLGDEEERILVPALKQAAAQGISARGPVAADTAFTPRSLACTDAVLCMYHDQALPVIKHRYFEEAVNLTLGLPIIRTSPDHGTALDLAGSGRASSASTLSALRLAKSILLRLAR